jgi:streptomycin 6-kinase
MYSLLQRVRGLEPMRVAFAEYVTRTGNAIVQRQGADAEMVGSTDRACSFARAHARAHSQVPDLLALKERLERLLRSAFADVSVQLSCCMLALSYLAVRRTLISDRRCERPLRPLSTRGTIALLL